MSLKIQKPLRKSTNILFFLRSLRGRGGLYLRGEFALIRFVCEKNDGCGSNLIDNYSILYIFLPL